MSYQVSAAPFWAMLWQSYSFFCEPHFPASCTDPSASLRIFVILIMRQSLNTQMHVTCFKHHRAIAAEIGIVDPVQVNKLAFKRAVDTQARARRV